MSGRSASRMMVSGRRSGAHASASVPVCTCTAAEYWVSWSTLLSECSCGAAIRMTGGVGDVGLICLAAQCRITRATISPPSAFLQAALSWGTIAGRCLVPRTTLLQRRHNRQPACGLDATALVAAERLEVARVLGVRGGIHRRDGSRLHALVDVHEREHARIGQGLHDAVPAGPLDRHLDAQRRAPGVDDAAHELQPVADTDWLHEVDAVGAHG